MIDDYGYKPGSTTVAAGTLIRDWQAEGEELARKVTIQDDGGPVQFKWVLPRGTLSKRMSVLELAGILGMHLAAVAPYMRSNANVRVYYEYQRLLKRILSMKPGDLDGVYGWCKSHVRKEQDDIVMMQLGGQLEDSGPSWFVMNGRQTCQSR